MKKHKKSQCLSQVATFFYLCCGGFGYAAFEDDTPGNLLTGFGFYEPYWLIDSANACIVLRLVGGYQSTEYITNDFRTTQLLSVSHSGLLGHVQETLSSYIKAQYKLKDHINAVSLLIGTKYLIGRYSVSPSLQQLIDGLSRDFQTSEFVNNEYIFILAQFPALRFNLFRLFPDSICGNTDRVSNDVSFTFWPLAICFPVEIYLARKNIRAWTRTWIAYQIFSTLGYLITIFSVTGSIQGLVSASLS